MSDIYEQIILQKNSRKLSNNDLGKVIGKTGDAFRMSLKRKSLNQLEIEKLEQYFGIENINEQIVNDPKELFNTKSGNNFEELSEGKYLMTVPLIPYKAQARYISEYSDAEFISELNRVSFVVDRVVKGKYRAFEIQNDSMNDGTIDSIPDGAIVLGRELQKHHWKNKFNINTYPFWIIVHQETIVCKQIIDHDTEKGTITCHSLNPSPEYPDFKLNLDEIHQMFNIVKKQT